MLNVIQFVLKGDSDKLIKYRRRRKESKKKKNHIETIQNFYTIVFQGLIMAIIFPHIFLVFRYT